MSSSAMKSIGFRNVYFYLFILAFFISSDDILFVVTIPFTLRLALILLSVFVFFGLIKMSQQSRIVRPFGYVYLIGWTFANIFSLQFSPAPFFSLVQTLSFVFYVILVLVVTNVVTPSTFPRLLNFYFMSFGFMSAFGLLQFFGGLFGFPFLASQKWFSHLYRISGLTYEPSFYAVYLSGGLITLGYLKYYKYAGLNSKRIRMYYNLALAAMILTTSRTGFLLLVIWYARLLPAFVANFLRGRISRTLLRALLAIFVALSACLVVALAVGPGKFSFLLRGTGVDGNDNYSVNSREDFAAETWNVFVEHPIFGVGVGGVNYYCALLRDGIATQDSSVLSKTVGANLTAETAASSGIVGFTFAVLYFAAFLRRLFQRSKRDNLVTAMTLGVFAELFLLQFSGNILRIYFWVQLAMLCATIRFCKSENKAFFLFQPDLQLLQTGLAALRAKE